MGNEHEIVLAVYRAKEDVAAADELIRAYIPFIRAEASRAMGRVCTEQEDEYSIALMAFHEAILGYERERGAFLNYAALLIRSRIIDFGRREARHRGHLSLHAESGEEGRTVLDTVADGRDHYEETANLEATQQEIEELAAVMAQFGISFTDIADNAPRQDRTREVVSAAIRCGGADRELLAELLRTKKLPLNTLVERSGAQRKTLERHRKYVLAMLLIQTNGYEIIRGHLRHVLRGREELRV